MTSRLEYHTHVRRSLPASVAAFAALALYLIVIGMALAPRASAQFHGAPSSVTSQGFGGRAINGTSPSVTSFGSTTNSRVTFSGTGSVSTGTLGSGTRDHVPHHHHNDAYGAGYWIGVPYAIDLAPPEDEAQQQEEDEDAGYQGGPTVFDRRGLGEESYVPPVNNMPRPHAAVQYASSAPYPEDDTPQPQTVLVFKNGQHVEVGNYAIQGDTLFDMTPGHPRKIALANLDLDATQQKNEDRGVMFALPATHTN